MPPSVDPPSEQDEAAEANENEQQRQGQGQGQGQQRQQPGFRIPLAALMVRAWIDQSSIMPQSHNMLNTHTHRGGGCPPAQQVTVGSAEERLEAIRVYQQIKAGSRFADSVVPGTSEPLLPQLILAMNLPRMQAALRAAGREAFADKLRLTLIGMNIVEGTWVAAEAEAEAEGPAPAPEH